MKTNSVESRQLAAWRLNGRGRLSREADLLRNQRGRRGATTIRVVSGVALLGLGLVSVILGIRMLLAPPTYRSTVRIKVERDETGIGGLRGSRAREAYDPYFIQTEFEVIQAEVVLGKVVEDLDLSRDWGAQHGDDGALKTSEAVALLRSRLDLRVIPNTSLIEIGVSGEKPEEAAKIANAIAEAYRAHRLERRAELRSTDVRVLGERLNEQDEKVRQAQERVDKLRAELNIVNVAPAAEGSPGGDADAPAPLMTAEALRKLETQRISDKAEYVRQTTLLERLGKLRNDRGDEQFAQAVSTVAEDASLGDLLERLSTAEQQLASATKEYGPQHTKVVKLKKQIEDLRGQMNQRINAVMDGLKTKVASLSNSLDNVNTEVQSAAQKEIARARQTRPYYEAKRELDELRRFRQVLDAKITDQKVQRALPETPLVEIVDRAVPPLRPSSPGAPQAAALIVVGFLMGIAGLFLLSDFSKV